MSKRHIMLQERILQMSVEHDLKMNSHNMHAFGLNISGGKMKTLTRN